MKDFIVKKDGKNHEVPRRLKRNGGMFKHKEDLMSEEKDIKLNETAIKDIYVRLF